MSSAPDGWVPGVHYYDRAGCPITLDQWVVLISADADVRRVASDEVEGIWVSTVWLGLDHNFISGPPLIFETMTFTMIDLASPTEFDTGGCWRWSTEAEALAGHAEVCLMVRASAATRKAEP